MISAARDAPHRRSPPSWRSPMLVALLLLECAAARASRPDISGPWQVKVAGQALVTITGLAPPLLSGVRSPDGPDPKGDTPQAGVDPMAGCLPPGVPRLMMQQFPFNIVQGRRTYALMFEWNHLSRLIYMDQPHFPSIGPVYLGQSVGHWEGRVLVVDTNSFNDETWLDDSGLAHSDQLHTVERFRLVHGGQELEDQITIDDPKTFAHPWTTRLIFVKRNHILIKEDYCLGRTGQGSTDSQ